MLIRLHSAFMRTFMRNCHKLGAPPPYCRVVGLLLSSPNEASGASNWQSLSSELKTKLGTGGTYKKGQIILQGDHRIRWTIDRSLGIGFIADAAKIQGDELIFRLFGCLSKDRINQNMFHIQSTNQWFAIVIPWLVVYNTNYCKQQLITQQKADLQTQLPQETRQRLFGRNVSTWGSVLSLHDELWKYDSHRGL